MIVILCTAGQVESEAFICSLQKFVEMATLGEFSTRLEIVGAFLEDMIRKGVCEPRHSETRDVCVAYLPLGAAESVIRCLGNTLMYYQQFGEAVEQSIKQLVSPVEKEFNVSLRDN